MGKSLGVLVSSDKHLDKIIHLCRAAQKKAVDVTIFFTQKGTLLTQDPRFSELGELANMSVCNVGFESHGLKPPVTGIAERDYATQARNADMICECDQYLVF